MRRALAAAAIALAACDASRPAPAVAPAAPRRLTVAFSGEDEGRLEPCGCSPAMLGGLARRKARIDASREEGVPMFVVSGGRVVRGRDRYDALQLGAILRAFDAIGVDAFAPSPREVALGPERLVPERPGRPRIVIARAAELSAGTERLVVGSGESDRPGGAPLVLLTDLDGIRARALANGLEGPALVVYAAGDTDPRDDDASGGRVALAPYPAHGRYVGLAHLAGDGASAAWTVEYRPVVSDLPEDAGVVNARVAMHAEMRESQLVDEESGNARFLVGRPPEGAYAGGETCGECHAEAARVQPSTRHASAMVTLARTGDDADPGCVKCHVVGYGTGRGHASEGAAASLGQIGCEACHGPRASHVEARRDGVADTPPAAKAAAACVACHDAEHDPGFDFSEAWPRIAHGGK